MNEVWSFLVLHYQLLLMQNIFSFNNQKGLYSSSSLKKWPQVWRVLSTVYSPHNIQDMCLLELSFQTRQCSPWVRQPFPGITTSQKFLQEMNYFPAQDTKHSYHNHKSSSHTITSRSQSDSNIQPMILEQWILSWPVWPVLLKFHLPIFSQDEDYLSYIRLT